MRRVEHSVEVGVPAGELFAYASSVENLPDWQSGIRSAERTSHGSMRVGARARVVRELMGQRIEAPLTVTEYDPPHHLALDSAVSGVHVRAVLDVATMGADRSRLTFAMEIAGSGLSAFMEPMIASAAEGDLRSSLDRLRDRLEA